MLSKSCSPSAADMVAKLFIGFKPPLCNTFTYSSHGGDLDTAGASGAARSQSRVWASTEVTLIWVVLFSWHCFH